jgi:hypothetical protein
MPSPPSGSVALLSSSLSVFPALFSPCPSLHSNIRRRLLSLLVYFIFIIFPCTSLHPFSLLISGNVFPYPSPFFPLPFPFVLFPPKVKAKQNGLWGLPTRRRRLRSLRVTSSNFLRPFSCQSALSDGREMQGKKILC